MKATRIITAVCWVITALALLGLAAWFVMGPFLGLGSFGIGNGEGWRIGFGWEALTGPYTEAGTYSIPPDGIGSLLIDWLSGEIKVRPHDGNDIVVTEFAQRALSEEETLRYRVAGGTLKIDFRQGRGAGRMPPKKIEVLVPRGLGAGLEGLSVDTSSGDVFVEGVGAGGIKIESSSGSVELTNATARSLNIDTVSGRISLASVYSDAMKFSSSSGAISAESSGAGSIEVDAISGRISLSGEFENADLESSSGRIAYTTTSASGELTAKSISGSIGIAGGLRRVSLESSSGRISLDSSAASTALSAKSISGDIKASGAFGSARFDTSSGDVSVSSRIVPDSLKADTTSGNITISIPGEDAVTVRHSSTSGRFSSDVPVILQNRGDAQFEISASSGDTRILALS